MIIKLLFANLICLFPSQVIAMFICKSITLRCYLQIYLCLYEVILQMHLLVLQIMKWEMNKIEAHLSVLVHSSIQDLLMHFLALPWHPIVISSIKHAGYFITGVVTDIFTVPLLCFRVALMFLFLLIIKVIHVFVEIDLLLGLSPHAF